MVDHPNAQKFYTALAKPDHEAAAEIRDIIADDPKILACFGLIAGWKHEPPPLTTAVKSNKLETAGVILDAMQQYSNTIMDQLQSEGRLGECNLGHPFYCRTMQNNNTGEFLPHNYINSPEMVALLHSKGYNLNARDRSKKAELRSEPDTSFYEHMVNQMRENLTEEGRIKTVEPILRKAMEVGVNPHTRSDLFCENKGSGDDIFIGAGVGRHAFCELCNALANTQVARNFPDRLLDMIHNPGIEPLPMLSELRYGTQLLAKVGIDCREIEKLDVNAEHLRSLTDIQKRIYQEMLAEFKAFSESTPKQYRIATTPNERTDYARAACATGLFPKLLVPCVKSDAKSGGRKETAELLSYLTPYWQEEYKHVILAAEASLARTSRSANGTESSALSKLLEGDTSTSRRGKA